MAVDDITIKQIEKQKRREYYLKNRDRILLTNAKSKEKNKESVLKSKKEYYEKIKIDPVWQAKQKEKRLINAQKKKEYDAKRAALKSKKNVERAKKWAAENKEKRSAIVFNYDSNRRLRKKTGLKPKEILEWKKSAKKICYWCGCKCEESFHIDHYFPLSKGGTHTLDNLVIACPVCNVKKNAKSPYEFAIQFGKLF